MIRGNTSARQECGCGMGIARSTPRKIPYGSQVVLPDGTKLAAVDTGSAVRTRRAARLSGRTASERNALVIDRFFETKRQALSWASRNPPFVPVRVAPPNYRPMTQTTSRVVVKTGATNQSSTSTVTTQTTTVANYPSTNTRSPLNKLGR